MKREIINTFVIDLKRDDLSKTSVPHIIEPLSEENLEDFLMEQYHREHQAVSSMMSTAGPVAGPSGVDPKTQHKQTQEAKDRWKMIRRLGWRTKWLNLEE